MLGAGFMGAGIASVAVQQGTLVRLKDTDTARIGKGLAALRGVVQERLAQAADHAAAIRRLPRARRRNDGLLRLRVGGSGDRGGVRGSRAQASSARRGRAGDRAVRGICVEHEHDSDHAHRRGGAPSRARARHALLLAGASDAAAGGHRRRADVARGDRDGGRVRQAARQDGDRRERRAGLLHDPHARRRT